MIKEYAIDPEVAGIYQNLRLISALFDYSNPRRISRFPRTWERLVCDAADVHGDMNKTRVVEKLAQLKGQKKCLHGFGRPYDTAQAWSGNIVISNAAKPYAGIICDADDPDFIASNDIDDTNPKLNAASSLRMLKSLVNYQNAFNETLKIARHIYIIDPFFSPYEPKCLPLFKDWFSVLNSRVDLTAFKLKICTSSDRNGGPYTVGDEVKMRNDIQERFCPRGINFDFSVKLVPHLNDMHDRYLLTDIACFSSGHSFAIDATVTTNISMMTKADGENTEAQYFNS